MVREPHLTDELSIKPSINPTLLRSILGMLDISVDTLSGKKEHIVGWYIFIVRDQSKIIAEGLMIMIYLVDSETSRWHGKSTGAEGRLVIKGEWVQVYNVDIEFH